MTESPDEIRIRELLADHHAAVCQKSVDRIMANYADDVVIFNVRPPVQIRGTNDWRDVWNFALSHFPASFGTEIKDMSVLAGSDVAVAHYLMRFTGMPGQTWIRVTTVCRKTQGRWLISHEHNSVPFDPEATRTGFASGG